MDREMMARLVERAKRGDADAFSALYENYYRSLYKAAYYILGNTHEAEDVVMDTVCDAYAGVKKLRTDAAFDGWLFRILYNKARRRRGALIYSAADELTEAVEAKGPDYGDISENADLMEALSRLDAQERAIIVLSVCSGYTSAEVAGIMSLNANTVRSKQMRALAKLRTRLERGEGGMD